MAPVEVEGLIEGLAVVGVGAALVLGAIGIWRSAGLERESHVGHRIRWNLARQRFECECGRAIAGGRDR